MVALVALVGSVNAEIFKGSVDGNKTFYTVTNKQINAVYVCEDADFYSVLIEAVESLGKPIYVCNDNKELNPEVAVITKKHGNSSAYSNGYFYLNTYDETKNTYQTYVW